MNLLNYLNHFYLSERYKFAKKVGISQAWLSILLSTNKRPSPALALKIEKATGGQVSRHELRPDIWPEEG